MNTTTQQEQELNQYLNEGDNRQRYANLYQQYAGDQRGWRNLSSLCRRLACMAAAQTSGL